MPDCKYVVRTFEKGFDDYSLGAYSNLHDDLWQRVFYLSEDRVVGVVKVPAAHDLRPKRNKRLDCWLWRTGLETNGLIALLNLALSRAVWSKGSARICFC